MVSIMRIFSLLVILSMPILNTFGAPHTNINTILKKLKSLGYLISPPENFESSLTCDACQVAGSQQPNSGVVLIYAASSVFSFVLFSTSPRSIFRLNHVRKAWSLCSHSRFSSEVTIKRFFFIKRRLVLLWATVATSLCQAITRSS